MNFSKALLPLSWQHDLAPIAAKVATHYGQLINSGKFRYYDHGIIRNLKAYGSAFPPEYNLSKIKVPVALLWGDNDNIANPTVEYIFQIQLAMNFIL